jgi:serine/threonine protein phosphatase 1
MMIDVLEGGSSQGWQRNGGGDTLRSYGTSFSNPVLPTAHYHFYKNTRFYYETDDFLFVHGGVDPNYSIADLLSEEENYEDFLWERAHLKASSVAWEKTVIFGHTPKPEPIINNYMIGIDTGCVYKNLPGLGKLTAVLLPEREFIFQPCIDNPNPY